MSLNFPLLKMKTKMYFTKALLALALPIALSSCSKQSDPVSTIKVADSSDVKLQNGRLVFANNDVFAQTLKSISGMTTPQLKDWEQKLGFQSLRAVDITQQEPSTALINAFGFSNQYATLINPSGEYQIGDRISWFHKGFRYIAHSESELAAIKANPTLATEKFEAGIQHSTNPTPTTPGGVTTLEVRNSDYVVGDGRYGNFEFLLNGDGNSRRKLNFESVLYLEDVSDKIGHGPNIRPFYTSIYINEYYEYYSRGQGSWYRCDDAPRVTTYNLTTNFSVKGTGYYNNQSNFNGTYYYSGIGAPVTGSNNISINGYSHSGGDLRTTISEAYLYLATSGGFTWTYQVTGRYSSYLSSDTRGVSNHVETGANNGGYLW